MNNMNKRALLLVSIFTFSLTGLMIRNRQTGSFFCFSCTSKTFLLKNLPLEKQLFSFLCFNGETVVAVALPVATH